MGQTRLVFVYFRHFLNEMPNIVQNWCAWDSNPGPQDCWRQENTLSWCGPLKLNVLSFISRIYIFNYYGYVRYSKKWFHSIGSWT